MFLFRFFFFNLLINNLIYMKVSSKVHVFQSYETIHLIEPCTFNPDPTLVFPQVYSDPCIQ